MQAREPLQHAVDYNLAVLRQAAALIQTVRQQQLPYAAQIGPHLRHVVEHYEEFLAGLPERVVDYDRRARDRSLEQQPELALARIHGVAQALRGLREGSWPESLAVSQFGGMTGNERFIAASSPLRELLFLAGHAIHHYAQLKPLLSGLGVVVSEDFGKAPATVRHDWDISG
jgi:uncharacterized damage-inducible protein DinB